MGLLEAFGLAEQYGAKCLTTDEILWLASARRRKGCRTVRSTLTAEDRRRVVELGARCKRWKEENR
jgi:hypothetical protein